MWFGCTPAVSTGWRPPAITWRLFCLRWTSTLLSSEPREDMWLWLLLLLWDFVFASLSLIESHWLSALMLWKQECWSSLRSAAVGDGCVRLWITAGRSSDTHFFFFVFTAKCFSWGLLPSCVVWLLSEHQDGGNMINQKWFSQLRDPTSFFLSLQPRLTLTSTGDYLSTKCLKMVKKKKKKCPLSFPTAKLLVLLDKEIQFYFWHFWLKTYNLY